MERSSEKLEGKDQKVVNVCVKFESGSQTRIRELNWSATHILT